MVQVHASLCLPNREVEYLTINLGSGNDLKDEIAKKISFGKDEIEVFYEGDFLADSDIIEDSCVQVFLKKPSAETWKYVHDKVYTKEDCTRIAKLFETITHTQINVNARLTILKKISEQFPEFKVNLCAQAMIRDIILFYTLDKTEVIEKIAKELPVICDAADFIVKTTRQELVKTTTSERTASAATSSTVGEENDLSYESSTSSDDDNAQSPRASSSTRPRGQITREVLENAVRGVAQSNNSLSNIAQRQQEGDGASGRNNPILSTDLSNAITQAMSSITTPQSGSSSTATAENPPPVESMETSSVDTESNFTDLPEMYRTHMYAEQMQTMRHMGLTNDSLNLSVLMMTSGALENAVNLVLAMADSPPS